MIEMRSGKIDFPSIKGSGPQTKDETVTFSNPIKNYVVLMVGHELKFDGGDHHFYRGVADLSSSKPSDKTIVVTGTLGLRDSSGSWDDPYSGHISYAIIAET